MFKNDEDDRSRQQTGRGKHPHQLNTKLIKVLKKIGRFLNPLPPTEGMGLSDMKKDIENIKDALGFNRNRLAAFKGTTGMTAADNKLAVETSELARHKDRP